MIFLYLEITSSFVFPSEGRPQICSTANSIPFSLIKAISSFYNPDLIIVIDALVSTSLDRLNKTIQLTDTGINLNGNYLDKKSLKVPVLAIGVPTVIDLKTLISTNIDMMVTPKEIDFIVDSLAYIISSSLNRVLHKI